MTTSWTGTPSGTWFEGIVTSAALMVGSAASAFTRPGIVTKDMYPPWGLLDGELGDPRPVASVLALGHGAELQRD